MENSILTSTKKTLGISEDYTAFDLDIITHINSALSVVNQVGVGPDAGMFITDSVTEWTDFNLPANQLAILRSYVYLKTRVVFDPPSTSFVIDALNRQISECEARLSYFREVALPATVTLTLEDDHEIEEGALFGGW